MFIRGLILSLCTALEGSPLNSEIERDLVSPFFEVRSRGRARVAELSFEDGSRFASSALTAPERELRIAALEWIVAQLRLGREGQLDLSGFLERYLAEKDPAVRMRYFHAAAELPSAIPQLTAARKAGRFPADELDRLLDARLIRLVESTMVEGRVPGFFDGQFAALHQADELAYIRLCRMAWDPRLHYVLRALAIMSLSEKRPKDLEQLLSPLLLDPRAEVARQQSALFVLNPTTIDARNDIQANLSQYVRFSLAKAGIAGPIDAKIRQLERQVSEYLAQDARYSRSDRDPSNGQEASFLLEEAMDVQFELGYHHQQLDRYDQAEAAYRVVISRPEALRAKRWAYYNLACIRSLTGRNEEAIQELENAVSVGFSDLSWAARDGDLKPLRDDPRFQAIVSGRRKAK